MGVSVGAEVLRVAGVRGVLDWRGGWYGVVLFGGWLMVSYPPACSRRLQ